MIHFETYLQGRRTGRESPPEIIVGTGAEGVFVPPLLLHLDDLVHLRLRRSVGRSVWLPLDADRLLDLDHLLGGNSIENILA